MEERPIVIQQTTVVCPEWHDREHRPWGALGITTAATALHTTDTAHVLACLKDTVTTLQAGCAPAFPLSFASPTTYSNS